MNGRCDTSEVILNLDGRNVKTDVEGRPTSVDWYSPYDDKSR
jgi:hypothetical protein